jgi:dTDP-4-amino-4,6-dideoxygalactose transaminase
MGMIKLPENSIEYFKNNLDKIFQSGNLAEGQWNKKLEGFVKDLTGSQVSVATNSNGAGLVALLSIYKYYYRRNKVLIQSNTMYGVKTMVLSSGCKLSGFINCQLESLMPSVQDIKDSISNFSREDKNRLIILLSHIGGIVNPDIEGIVSLCKDESIILLEDCAHSFGATLKDGHSGLFGDAGVYSFYATKAIPAGEGGVVVSNNVELGEMISKFSIYDRFDQKLEIGNNIRISEVQALLSFSVVKEWKSIIDNKIKIANQYIEKCLELNIDHINQNKNGQKGNYYKFIILSKLGDISTEMSHLQTTTSKVYDYCLGNSKVITTNHACLPIWYGQSPDVAKKVVKELEESAK